MVRGIGQGFRFFLAYLVTRCRSISVRNDIAWGCSCLCNYNSGNRHRSVAKVRGDIHCTRKRSLILKHWWRPGMSRITHGQNVRSLRDWVKQLIGSWKAIWNTPAVMWFIETKTFVLSQDWTRDLERIRDSHLTTGDIPPIVLSANFVICGK